VAWLILIPAAITLAALPATFIAVAVRPSSTTLRAAGITLLAVPVVVVLAAIIGAMA